ncbi:MAG: hypothetical protein ABJ004_19125 [Cyclobacteriaceae bacterium]
MEIYEILSKLVGLKFKAQFNNCGIEFSGIYKITNLQSTNEYYCLITTDSDRINFKDKTEFLTKFIALLERNIQEFDRRFEELRKTSNDRWVDENALYMEHEEIGHYGSKQSKLLEKMKQFKQDI